MNIPTGNPNAAQETGGNLAAIAANTAAVEAATGLVSDAASTDSTSSWSVIALLKGIWAQLASVIAKFGGGLPAGLGTGGGIKVDGSGTPLPVSGTVAVSGTSVVSGSVTANAGTNLNTSALALESGGNLAAIAAAEVTGNASLASIATNTAAGATSAKQDTGNASLATVATAQGAQGTGFNPPTGGTGVLGFLSGIYAKLLASVAVTGTFWQATQPVSIAATVQVSESGIDNSVLDTQSIVAADVGTAYNTAGYGLLSFQFAGNWAGAIQIQGSNDGTWYFPLQVRNASSDDTQDVISGAGLYLLTPTTTYVQYNVEQVVGTISAKVVGKIGQSTPSPLALAQSMDPATGVQIQANIAGGIGRDINNNLIVSDAPVQINLSGAVGTPLIIDTLGYQSLQITTQALVGNVGFSNDKITWLIPSYTNVTSTVIADSRSYVYSCVGRYMRIVPTAAGTAVAYLRSTPSTSIAITGIGSSDLVVAGAPGVMSVGGNIAPGVAPTANPLPTGAVDASGLTRRILSDSTGRLTVTGSLPAAGSFQNAASLLTQFGDMVDGRPMPDLFAQMLTELQMISYYLYNLPEAINRTTPGFDDPVYYRSHPEDLL